MEFLLSAELLILALSELESRDKDPSSRTYSHDFIYSDKFSVQFLAQGKLNVLFIKRRGDYLHTTRLLKSHILPIKGNLAK